MQTKKYIYNLDEQIESPRLIKLRGVEIDISFIPCGVAIPLLKSYDAWVQHTIASGGEEGIKNDINIAEENANLMIQTLAIFTSFHDDKFNEDWIKRNLDMQAMSKIITELINVITGKNKSESNTEDKKKEKSNGNE